MKDTFSAFVNLLSRNGTYNSPSSGEQSDGKNMERHNISLTSDADEGSANPVNIDSGVSDPIDAINELVNETNDLVQSTTELNAKARAQLEIVKRKKPWWQFWN